MWNRVKKFCRFEIWCLFVWIIFFSTLIFNFGFPVEILVSGKNRFVSFRYFLKIISISVFFFFFGYIFPGFFFFFLIFDMSISICIYDLLYFGVWFVKSDGENLWISFFAKKFRFFYWVLSLFWKFLEKRDS